MKLCPNECGTELQVIDDKTLLCPKCEIEFHLTKKGEVVIIPEDEGTLKQHEICIAELQKEVSDLKEKLFGKTRSTFPF
jgi:hypothetical protein